MSDTQSDASWIFPADGEWGDASDWSTGMVPGGPDVAVSILAPSDPPAGDEGSIVQILDSNQYTAGSVTIAGTDDASGIPVLDTLQIGGTLELSTTATIGGDGVIELEGGTLGGSVVVDGDYPGGLLEGFGTVVGGIDNTSCYAHILADNPTASAASVLTVTGSIDNNGVLAVDNVRPSSSMAMVVEGDVTGNGGSIELGNDGASSRLIRACLPAFLDQIVDRAHGSASRSRDAALP